MEYKFALERPNYADLASGRVLYNLPGHPAFPIRLASEIFQRCLAHLEGDKTAVTLYDPCCGAAYHLTVIAYLHWNSVAKVICSDIDEKAVQAAGRNLGLLSPAGMERRSREIAAMVHLFGKASHREAYQSAQALLEQVTCLTGVRSLHTQAFQADATNPDDIKAGLQETKVDVVTTDIPYGLHSQWQGRDHQDPLQAMLEALLPVLTPQSIVAISSDKSQKAAHQAYQRLEKFLAGKRQVVLLKPIS